MAEGVGATFKQKKMPPPIDPVMLKECLHVVFLLRFRRAKRYVFWIAWDLIEVPKNTAFNTKNGFGTHSVRFS